MAQAISRILAVQTHAATYRALSRVHLMNAQAVAAIGEAIERGRKRRAISLRLGTEDAALLSRVASEAGVKPAECARLLVTRGLAAITGTAQEAA